MRIIGLTGGIASGKSTVSRILQSFGVASVDADALARALAEPGEALYEAYAAHWGARVLLPDGKLDRRGIGRIVFSNTRERQWLDAISHPLLYQAASRQLAALRASGTKVAVLDAPLLFEAGWDRLADEVWVVTVPREIQLRRLRERDHCTAEEARQRMNAQMPQEEKILRADVVIENCGSEEALRRRVQEVFRRSFNGAAAASFSGA